MNIQMIISLIISAFFLIFGIIAKTSKKAFQYTYQSDRVKEENILDVNKFNELQAKKFFSATIYFLVVSLIVFLVGKYLSSYNTLIFLFSVLVSFLLVFITFATIDKELESVIKKKKVRKNR